MSKRLKLTTIAPHKLAVYTQTYVMWILVRCETGAALLMQLFIRKPKTSCGSLNKYHTRCGKVARSLTVIPVWQLLRRTITSLETAI